MTCRVEGSQSRRRRRSQSERISGYIAHGLHQEPWSEPVLGLPVDQKMFWPRRLQHYREETARPNCDQVCQEMAMIRASGPLRGAREDMDDLVAAIFKVYENRDQLSAI